MLGDCAPQDDFDKDVKMIKNSTFHIRFSLVIVCSVIINALIILMVHMRLKKRYMRIKEERIAYMSRASGFEFDLAEEERKKQESRRN